MTDPLPGGPTGEDLARALRADAPGALDAWFRAEHPRVWKLCFALLADAAEADDVAQDAMLHLHDRLESWDDRGPYRAWRSTVVANLCRDRRRRTGARRSAEREAAALGLPARLPDPDAPARAKEAREALRCALAALPEREREAFVLRDLEGVGTRETAEVLGVTPSTVRSLATLARRRLRELLAVRVPGLLPEGGEL